MVPAWLETLAIVSLVVAFVCAAVIVADLFRRPQRMAVMNPVWPITALYLGPVALWSYWTMGRGAPPQHGSAQREQSQSHQHDQSKQPFWQQAFKGTTHCGAGCTLGDIIAEFVVFFGGVTLLGSTFGAELAGDFLLAYLLGLVFQYFSIVPMRGLSPKQGIWAAAKADTLSLIAFEIGLFGWMAIMRFGLFRPPLHPDQPAYWFMMQIGMAIGFATSYPVNRWLIHKGIKEAM